MKKLLTILGFVAVMGLGSSLLADDCGCGCGCKDECDSALIDFSIFDSGCSACGCENKDDDHGKDHHDHDH